MCSWGVREKETLKQTPSVESPVRGSVPQPLDHDPSQLGALHPGYFCERLHRPLSCRSKAMSYCRPSRPPRPHAHSRFTRGLHAQAPGPAALLSTCPQLVLCSSLVRAPLSPPPCPRPRRGPPVPAPCPRPRRGPRPPCWPSCRHAPFSAPGSGVPSALRSLLWPRQLLLPTSMPRSPYPLFSWPQLLSTPHRLASVFRPALLVAPVLFPTVLFLTSCVDLSMLSPNQVGCPLHFLFLMGAWNCPDVKHVTV